MDLAPRRLPPETVEGLRPPRDGFSYFEHANRFPFLPDISGFSAANASWLADACLLVYGDAAFIEKALVQTLMPEQGFRLGWLGTPDDNRGMILTSDSAVIVVFRGTRLQVRTLLDVAEVVLINQNDLWTDSRFLPAVHQAGGRVHSGFLKAFAEISDRLDAVVRARQPGQQLWLAGHSLGGALATLAAAHIGRDAVQGLYTYGCPRVGDAAFASVLPERSHYRFVHRGDWVATVPPEFLGYVHAGTPQQVPGSPPREYWGDFTRGTGEFAKALVAMARELRVSVGELPFKVAGLADHAPIYYATLLWNALADTAQERE
jgi:triacylglycerol lipase